MNQYETETWTGEYDGGWRTTVYVETFKYVDHAGVSNWRVGDILDVLNGAMAFINETEGTVDPKDVLMLSRSVVGETLRLRYNRPATEEEIAQYKKDAIDRKVEAKKRLLAELAELENEA